MESWVRETRARTSSASPTTVREVDLSGAVRAGPFSVPSGGVAGAVRDGIVVSAHGSIYIVDRSGSARRVGAGDAVAAGGNTVIAAQCDDQLRCGVVLIDVDSSIVRPVDGLSDANSQGTPFVISPDGSTAAVLKGSQTGPTSLLLVDLATGELSILDEAVVGFSPMTPSYSRDSQWLFFSTGLETFAYRLGVAERKAINVGSSRITALAAI